MGQVMLISQNHVHTEENTKTCGEDGALEKDCP